MNDETREGDVEEVVLTRWGRIKQWIEILVATKKVAMLIWGLLFATGGAVVVGQATDTTPIRDVAVELGIVQERATQEVSGGALYLDELLNLQEDIATLEEWKETHADAVPVAAVGAIGPKGDTGDTGEQGATGEQGERGDRGEQGLAGKSVEGGSVGSIETQINDALLRHIQDDH